MPCREQKIDTCTSSCRCSWFLWYGTRVSSNANNNGDGKKTPCKIINKHYHTLATRVAQLFGSSVSPEGISKPPLIPKQTRPHPNQKPDEPTQCRQSFETFFSHTHVLAAAKTGHKKGKMSLGFLALAEQNKNNQNLPFVS